MGNKIRNIFVYGTLKVGGRLASSFDSHRVGVVHGAIPGQLFAVKGAWFPAVRLAGKGVVKGELHRYNDFEKVLARFDQIEGYREGETDNLYNRREVDVTTDHGKLRAYVYEFNGSRDLVEIESGEWDIGG